MPSLSLGEVLRASAARNARHEAIVDGARRITYAELDGRVDRLAHALAARGVRGGDVVAVLSLNGHELLEAYFACARLGAAMCPLNPRSSAEEVAWTLGHAGARLVLAEAELQGGLERAADAIELGVVVHRGEPARPGWARYEALIEAAPGAPFAGPEPQADAPVLLLYTLKGQGEPLGATLSHANVLADTLTALTYARLDARDRVLQGMPLNHVAGLHILTIAALVQGATVVIARQWRPDIVCELVAREHCTITVMVPTALRQLLESEALARADLRSLTRVIGAAGQYDRALFAEALYRLRLEQMLFGYGLTEASPIVTVAATSAETLWKENALGWPVWYNRVRLVRSDGTDAPPGESGEIRVKGPNVFLGYHDAPLATAAALTPDRWLRTGDLATMDAEGCLFFAGRLGASIKSGGENVDAIEVEQAILACAPEVRSAAVVGRRDLKWGERVIACCTLHAGRTLDAAELGRRLRERLAGFKLPREVHFLDALPLTESGAIDRARLHALLDGAVRK
ncbi:MAG: AMP-binding protein [Burkholderiales bacterium]|nr:AMP-binding protein [Burkholderiales bacterium]